ncbi:MAG: hypothetical protein ACJ8AT_20760 [Hyalangium sp.]|uniref:hypothetical protein n=1 Tax=Hyalangium sp. TaxID=2028555 RepID=UPI003899E764
MAGTNGTETTAVPSTLAEARVMILKHEAQANAEHYHIGRIFNRVVDQGLAGARTEESARRYLSSWLKAFSGSVLAEFGMVAREFPEAVCRKYGMRSLRLLLAYARKRKVSVSGKDPGLMLIRVPGADGPAPQKPFARCTRDELGRSLTGGLPPAPDSGEAPRAELHCLQVLRDGLAKRFGESAPFANARVRQGKLQITLSHLTVEELEGVAEAIRESLEPLREERRRKLLAQPPVLNAVPSFSRVGEASHAATALHAP